MHITYLEHCGFMVEMEAYCLVFDYRQGELAQHKDKEAFFFVSHGDAGHYHPDIFSAEEHYKKVHFILSEDDMGVGANRIAVKGGMNFDIGDLHIHVLNAYDAGVAFLVEVGGISVYHAGALNWWHWEEENNAKENEQAKQRYLSAIALLQHRHLDAAFVILDPRQGEQFYYGLHALMQICSIDYVFPMQMWGDYGIIRELKQSQLSAPYRDRIVEIHHPQEQFHLTIDHPCL